jgi:hypothetical protein
MTIIGDMLVAPKSTAITVTRINPKADKQGLFQIFGYRTGDMRQKMVMFWVFRKEAEEIVHLETTLAATTQAEVEVDDNAWTFVLAGGAV